MTVHKPTDIELLHAQKMEAVGRLAAGIAHEINTPIQFIGDNLHFANESTTDLLQLLGLYKQAALALQKGEGDLQLGQAQQSEEAIDIEYIQENLPAAFERIKEGLGRVSRIVRAMKEFSHESQEDQASADINQSIESTLTVSKSEYKYLAEVDLQLGALPPVRCYIADLNQVFLNLVVNAAHAIAEGRGEATDKGLITIRTFAEGDDAVIQIADNGAGIPPQIRERVFDPFFTTKPVGKGTGQGLALSYAVVVEKHGGRIEFQSEVGQGTCFTVRLPLQGKPA